MTANETVDFYEGRCCFSQHISGTVDTKLLMLFPHENAKHQCERGLNPKKYCKILEQLNANLLVRLIIFVINWIKYVIILPLKNCPNQIQLYKNSYQPSISFNSVHFPVIIFCVVLYRTYIFGSCGLSHNSDVPFAITV